MHVLALLALLSMVCNLAQADSSLMVGNGLEERFAWAVAVDPEGFVYIGGFYAGFLEGGAGQARLNRDGFVMKFNSSGSVQWSHRLDGVGSEYVYGVAIGAQNHVFGAGYTTHDVGGLDPYNTNYDMAFVFSLDSSGNRRWLHRFGSSAGEVRAFTLALDSQNNAFIAGHTQASLEGQPYVGNKDMFVAKWNSTGSLLWTRMLGTFNAETVTSATVDASGAVYVVGSSQGELDGQTKLGSQDVVMVKWNGDGVRQFTRQWGSSTTNAEEAESITIGSNGDVYVTGLALGSPFDGETLASSQEWFLTRWTTSGTRVWTKAWGRNTFGPHAITADPHTNRLVAVGYSVLGGVGLGFTPTYGSADIFLSVLTNDGIEVFSRVWGTSGFDRAHGVAVGPKGEYWAVGVVPQDITGFTSTGGSDTRILLSAFRPTNATCEPGSISGSVLAPRNAYDKSLTECSACPIGTYGQAGATTCTACAGDTTSFLPGQTDCNATFPVVSFVQPVVTPIQGGTVVDLTGNLFPVDVQPVWRTENGTELAGVNCVRLSASRITCTTPVFSALGNVSVLVPTNITGSGYIPPTMEVFSPIVTTFARKSGPTSGGTVVAVDSVQLSPRSRETARCSIGGQLSTPTQLSATQIVCVTAANMQVGPSPVRISLDGQHWHTASGGNFTAYSTVLTSVTPRSGLDTGFTQIVVRGTGLVNGRDQPRVRIVPSDATASQEYAASFDPEQSILATTQPFAIGALSAGATLLANISVSPNGGQYLAHTVPFFLYPEHGLGSVTPSTVPAGIPGITLNLAPAGGGKTFADTGNEIRVRVRTPAPSSQVVTVAGARQAATQIQAQLPVLEHSGWAQVAVALNGQQWSEWLSLTAFRVTGLSPQWGPWKGGTVVTLSGHGFNDTAANLKCRFAQQEVSATYVSVSTVVCTSPNNMPNGTVAVEMTTNGQTYTNNSGMFLTTGGGPVVHTIQPAISPARLAVPVTLVGSGFIETGNTVVQFGSTSVAATRLNATHVVCTVPSLPTGTYDVRVSTNGQTDPSQLTAAGAVTFETVPPFVGTITPSSASLSGGTVLSVSGINILDASVAGSLRVWIKSTPAVIVELSSTPLVFTMPSLEGKVTVGPNGYVDVEVEVSTSGGALWSGDRRTLRVYRVPAFTSVFPRVMPLAGGTSVTLEGQFASVSETTLVRLQDSDGWQSDSVAASKSTTSVTAILPAYKRTNGAGATVKVWMALNGADWFDTQVSMTVYAQPSVLSVDPDRKTPGEVADVTIQGSGFFDSGSVVVQMGAGQVFVPKRLTATEIVVESPANHSTAVHLVEVSLDNGQHYASTRGVTLSVLQDVLSCPSNTDSIRSTPLDVTDCQCKAGFFREDGRPGLACEACPENADCVGLLTQPVAKVGFFRTGERRYVRCAVESACLGGASSTCAPGYQGILCGTCSPGYFKLGNTCQPCQAGSGGTVVLLVALFILYLFFVKKQGRAGPRKNTGKVAALAITHLQVISTFGEFRLNWPDSVESTLNSFSLANFNIDTASPECSVAQGWTAETRFWTAMLLPVLLAVGLLLRVAGQYLLSRWVLANGEAFGKAHPVFCAEPDATLPKWRYALSLVRHNVSTLFTEPEMVDHETMRRLVNEMVFSMGLLYITLCTRVLEVFDCSEVREGFSVMDTSPNVQCWVEDGVHARLVAPAVLFLFVYVLGTPAAFLAVMLRARDPEIRAQPEFQQRYSTIYSKYAPHYFWFEAMVLLRKASVVGVKLFATNLPALQGLLGMVVLGGAAQLQASFHPYKTTMQNNLEGILLVESLLLLVAGMVFVTGADSAGREGWEGLTMTVAVSVVVVCAWYVGRDVWQGVQDRQREGSMSEDDKSSAAVVGRFVAAVSPFVHADYHRQLAEIAENNLTVAEMEAVEDEVRTLRTTRRGTQAAVLESAREAIHEDDVFVWGLAYGELTVLAKVLQLLGQSEIGIGALSVRLKSMGRTGVNAMKRISVRRMSVPHNSASPVEELELGVVAGATSVDQEKIKQDEELEESL